jgi:hypothetical protein
MLHQPSDTPFQIGAPDALRDGIGGKKVRIPLD